MLEIKTVVTFSKMSDDSYHVTVKVGDMLVVQGVSKEPKVDRFNDGHYSVLMRDSVIYADEVKGVKT